MLLSALQCRVLPITFVNLSFKKVFKFMAWVSGETEISIYSPKVVIYNNRKSDGVFCKMTARNTVEQRVNIVLIPEYEGAGTCFDINIGSCIYILNLLAT